MAHKFTKIPKLQNASIKFVIRASFYIFCALFSSFNVLSGCFYVSLSLVAVPNASIFLWKPSAITSYFSRKKNNVFKILSVLRGTEKTY